MIRFFMTVPIILIVCGYVAYGTSTARITTTEIQEKKIDKQTATRFNKIKNNDHVKRAKLFHINPNVLENEEIEIHFFENVRAFFRKEEVKQRNLNHANRRWRGKQKDSEWGYSHFSKTSVGITGSINLMSDNRKHLYRIKPLNKNGIHVVVEYEHVECEW